MWDDVATPDDGLLRAFHHTEGAMPMPAIRRADVTWTGPLATGAGTVSAISSGAFADLPVTWASRTESSDGRTSPEELVAAAHAACFAMALLGATGPSAARRRTGWTSPPRSPSTSSRPAGASCRAP